MTIPKKKYPFGKKVVDELLLLGANDDFKLAMDNFSKKYNPPADDDSGIDGKKEIEFMQNSRIFYMIKECMGIMEKYRLTKLFDYMMWYFVMFQWLRWRDLFVRVLLRRDLFRLECTF